MAEMTTDKEVENPLEVRKLQSTGRVDIPTEMHRAMGVDEGDNIFVKWDESEEEIKIMPVDPDMVD